MQSRVLGRAMRVALGIVATSTLVCAAIGCAFLLAWLAHIIA